jgi:NADH dehydrogenase
MATRHRASRICILGGTGFVGRSLVGRLIQAGHNVVVLTRSRDKSRALWIYPAVELLEVDVHDERALADALRGCDAAVNLIGILNEDGHDGEGFKRVHADLPARLVRSCRTSGVHRLLHMSALKADAQLGPSHYLRTKGLGEAAIRELAGSEVKYTIFQPSVIFGATDSFTNRFARLLRMLPMFPLPQSEARFAPVYVDDVARAFVAALENSDTHGRTYQLCGPDIYSLAEIVRLVTWTLGLKRLVVPLPHWLGRAQAWIGEYLLPGKPLSLDNFRSLSEASVCSADGFASFGIKPQSLGAILPTYLARAGRQGRLASLRQSTRR